MIKPGLIPSLESQAQAEPELWRASTFYSLKNSNFLGHSQKVGPKPRSSLGPSHNFEPKPGLGLDPSLGKIISSKQHLQGKNYIQLLITWPWSSVALWSKFYSLFLYVNNRPDDLGLNFYDQD